MAHRLTLVPLHVTPARRGFALPRKRIIDAETELPPGDFRATLRARWAANRAAQRVKEETMGYTITPLVTVASAAAVVVSDEQAAEFKEFYDHLTKNPGQVGLVTFDTADEAKPFMSALKSWAVGNKLIARQLPGKDLPPTQVKFSIYDEAEAAKRAAESEKRKEAREAKAKAKADKEAAEKPAETVNA